MRYWALILGSLLGCGSSETDGNGGSGGTTSSSGGSGGGELKEPQVLCAEQDAELGVARPEGWEVLSHCKFAPADVETVFPSNKVLALTIVMKADEYAAMQADLTDLMGGGGTPPDEDPLFIACEGLKLEAPCEVDQGGGAEPGICNNSLGPLLCIPLSWFPPQEWQDACEGLSFFDPCTTNEHEGFCEDQGLGLACFPNLGPPPASEDPCLNRQQGDSCQQGSKAGECLSSNGPLICQADGFDSADLHSVPLDEAVPFWSREPLYFHAEILFAGARYENVGIRYKGNNGLASAVGEKKPLRLKMDEWEDEHPEITDQRLFGFQHLSFSPNQTDPSNLRQVLATEVFRRQGVPTFYASFVEVSLDTGDGPRLLGVYAMSEVPDNPLLEREFGSDEGNFYKADGRGAHFVTFEEESFHRQNNDSAPMTELENFISALHASQADRSAWRADLRATFNIDAFAEFFAVNQVIGNWDTYGGYAHNFYLHADRDSSQITFIPWDFDLAFDGSGPSDHTLSSFNGQWPLLQAVARDVEFGTLFRNKLQAVAVSELDEGRLAARVDELETLLTEAIERETQVRPDATTSFQAGLASLRAHLQSQQESFE
jgi:spore coat protein H